MNNPQIRALYKSGVTQVVKGNIDSAGIYFERGLALAISSNEQFLTATGLYHQSYFYEQKHDLSQALSSLGESLSIFESLGKKINVGNCYNSFNRIYQTLGNYSKALSYGLQALRIKEELNDLRGLAMRNLARVRACARDDQLGLMLARQPGDLVEVE